MKESASRHADSDTTSARGAMRFGWPQGCFLALMLFCAVSSWRALNADDDFWAHAAVGRWIWNHHAFPQYSLFLWSVDRFPWVAHSWLSQLFFYGLLQAGGGWTPVGDHSAGTGPLVVTLFTVVVICAIWATLWRLWNRTSRPATTALLLFALAIWASSLRYHPRPELLTALFWTLLLCALVGRRNTEIEYSNDGKSRRGWTKTEIALPFLFALWANFHGAVALGVLLMGITTLCDAAQDRFDGRSRRLMLLFAACVLATALVPYGARQYWTSVLSSSQSAMFTHIMEWQPLLPQSDLLRFARGGAGPDLLFYALAECVLAVAALLAWNANPQRRWSQMAWIVVMGVLLLRQRRHLWLFALVCVAVMAANAAFFETRSLLLYVRERFSRFGSKRQAKSSTRNALDGVIESEISPRLRLLLRAAVLVWIAIAALTNASSDLWARHAVSPLLPDAASHALENQARVLRTKGAALRVFNDYENSSYLQWRLNTPKENDPSDRGACPLYIDLLNAYPDSVLRNYLETANLSAKGKRFLQDSAVNCVVLSKSWRKKKTALFLDGSPQWRRLYRGDDGDVWVRQPPRNSNWTGAKKFPGIS